MRFILQQPVRLALLPLILFVFIAVHSRCSSPTDSSGTADESVTLASIRFTDQDAAGWSPDSSQYKTYDDDTLYNFINGGAEPYSAIGLQNGFYQTMTAGDGRSVECMVNDFGDAAAADSMFRVQKVSFFNLTTVTGYTEDVAVSSPNLAGATVFARFDRFFLQLAFNGYNNPDSTGADASLFVSTYQSKITQ